MTTGVEWLNADPYLWRHLAEHAGAGGVLDDLITDVGFLAVADPERLLPELPRATDVEAQEIGSLYERVAARIYQTDALERMALLHLAACQEAPELAQRLEPLLEATWRCRWAVWPRSSRHLMLGGHKSGVGALALSRIKGDLVIVSGGDDRMLRVWDVRTGRAVGEPKQEESEIKALAIGDVDGEPVAVTGTYHGIAMWPLTHGGDKQVVARDRSVNSLAIGVVDGTPLIVAGGTDQYVRVWNARTRRPRRKAMSHRDRVKAVAFGSIDGEPVIVSAGADRTARVWDARTGEAAGKMLTHTGGVSSVAVGEVAGDPVIVTGGAKVWVWDARTRLLRGEPLAASGVVAIDTIGAESLIASALEAVHLWDASSGRQLGEPLAGHDGRVVSIALGAIDAASVVVTGGEDGTIRVWDTRAAETRTGVSSVKAGDISCVAIGRIGDEVALVSGGVKGMVRFWNPATGRPQGEPITGPDATIDRIWLDEIDGRPVVVTFEYGRRWTIRVRDARTGKKIGKVISSRDWFTRVAGVGKLDDDLVILTTGHGELDVWEAATGKRRGSPIQLDATAISEVAFANVGGDPLVAYEGMDLDLHMMSLHSRRERTAKTTAPVDRLVLGEVDGMPVVVAAGSFDGSVHIYRAGSGRRLGRPFVGHERSFDERSVSSLVVGQVFGRSVVVSGGADGVVHVWDPLAGTKLVTLEPGGAVADLALGAEGELVIATNKGLVMVDLLFLKPTTR